MDSNDIEHNLKARGGFSSLMDLRDAHLLLREKGEPIDVEKEPPSTPVWQYMAKIMLAHDGHENWRDKECVKNYVRTQLGREKSKTFLTELSPIPCRRNGDKKWVAEFSRIQPLLSQRISKRKDDLRSLLDSTHSSLVICYGGGVKQAQNFATLLGIEWRKEYGKIRTSANSRHLLLPFFGNGQMSHAVIEDLISSGLLSS